MNYKFQSKYRNCAFVIIRSLPGNPSFGIPQTNWFHLKFTDGVCTLPEEKADEIMDYNNKKVPLIDLIRSNSNFNKEFFEVEEIKADITKSVLNGKSNRVIDTAGGYMGKVENREISVMDILNNPEASKLIQDLALQLAKNISVSGEKNEDTVISNSQDANEVVSGKVGDVVIDEVTAKEEVKIEWPKLAKIGEDTDLINWGNLTIAGRAEPYKNLNALKMGLKAKGVEIAE